MRSGKRLQYWTHSWRLLAFEPKLATTLQPLPLQFRAHAGDFGISPVSIAEIPHLVEGSAGRLC
jgi:hypothetical protein